MTKTRAVKYLWLVAGALTALSLQAEGDDHHACQGGSRVANLDQALVLTPTTNAPAGAKGKAEFIAVNDNGTNYEALFVKTVGLTEGVFTVSLTDDTGANTYTLGTLNVTTLTNAFGCGDGDDEENEDGDHEQGDGAWCWQGGQLEWSGDHHGPGAGWTNWVHACAGVHPDWTNLLHLHVCTNLYSFATNTCHWYSNTLTVGSGSFVLPPGLSETNAGVLTISDADGNVDLSGDFTSATNSTVVYREMASLVPGTATNAQGSATVTYRMARSRACGTFRLDASGLPGHTKLYLTADAARTIKVFTRKDGTLKVRCFPRVDLSTLSSVVATDGSSNVVFSVNF